MDISLNNGLRDDIRVLLIDLSKRYGGASVRALTLARHLQPWGAAIAGLVDSPVVKFAKERNIPIRLVGKSRINPLIPLRLRKIIKKDHFRIIDTQNIQSKFWGSFTALLVDVAFVATLNSSYKDEQGRSLKGKFYALIDRWTNFRTDRYIAVSDTIMKGLLKAGIPTTMVDLITNAVDLDASSITDDPKAIRRQVGIPEDAFLYVSVGRLVWAKGYEDFIAAFTSVVNQIPNAYALIMGDGVLFPSLSKQIKVAGLENRFMLLGHCEPSKVWTVLKASDVFVMSSRSEGVPFALLEAAALGLPILSTRCGGIPEILTDKVDALLVPVGEPQALYSGMINLYHDQQMAQRLGINAREKIERDFSIPAQIEATKSAYLKALEHHNREITVGDPAKSGRNQQDRREDFKR